MVKRVEGNGDMGHKKALVRCKVNASLKDAFFTSNYVLYPID
jgi:hypothetical protein